MTESEKEVIEIILDDIQALDNLFEKDYFEFDDYMKTRNKMIERLAQVHDYFK